MVLKVWPGTRNIKITWELFRNTNPGPHPRFNGSETLGVEPSNVHFLTSPPGNSEVQSSLRTTDLEDEILPSLRIFKDVLLIFKAFRRTSFQKFLSKVGVHVWPLRGTALRETGLPLRHPGSAT